MNTILCNQCGATIPLRTTGTEDETAPTDNYTCPICDPPKKAQGEKKGCSRFLHILGVAVFALAGIGLQKCSFEKVANIRQLARVPRTEIQALVPGEANLRGSAEASDKQGGALLDAPRSKKKCLYYRYLVERRERDSDGDTRWVTERDEQKFVPDFLLRDDTGAVVVRPGERVDFNVGTSDTWRQGDRRFTEFRIDPGEALFVFGYAEAAPPDGAMLIHFDKEGDYQPLVSEKTELAERTGRATTSIIACWIGLVMIGVATLILFSLFGKHRLLFYFWMLSTSVGATLVILGVGMMRSDLRAAYRYVDRQGESVRTVVTDTLKGAGLSWDGEWETLGDFDKLNRLTDTQRERLGRARINLVAASRRIATQGRKFPYSWIRGTLDIPEIPEVPLPAIDEGRLDELEAAFQPAKLTGYASWIFGVIALLAAIFTTLFGFRFVKRKRMSENLATSPTSGVAYGLAELKGIIDLPEGIDPLRGPVSGQPCVYYDYEILERRGSGKKAKWVRIHHETQHHPFLCRDREGTFPIEPEGATVMAWRKKSRREGMHKHVESRLQFGDPLYAVGSAEIDPEAGDRLQLRKPERKDEPFVLSSFTEEAVVAKLGFRSMAWLTAAFGSVLLAGLLLFASGGAFSPADYLAAAFLGPVYMVGLTLVLHYNDLVFLRQRARRDWHNIEVSLRKRADLVPAMVEAAKAYMGHEAGLLERLTSLRSGYAGRSFSPDAASQLLAEGKSTSTSFMALVENYPDLKASTQTALVTRQLVALEDEIAFMRGGYNNAVTQYNTRIAVFPDLVFARMGGFRPMNLLTYEAEVVPMPEIAAETWRRQQAVESAEAPTAEAGAEAWLASPLPLPDPGAPVIEAAETRAALYASLLDETGEGRERQVALIREADGDAMADAVAAQIEAIQTTDAWTRLVRAREQMPELRGMSAEAYLQFKGVARRLIESDERITTYEYAFQKALDFLVDPVFTTFEAPEIRYERAEDEGLAASVAVLRDYLSDPAKHDNLGPFDTALRDARHAGANLRGQLYGACHQAYVGAGDEQQSTRWVLLQALADGLFLEPGG